MTNIPRKNDQINILKIKAWKKNTTEDSKRASDPE